MLTREEFIDRLDIISEAVEYKDYSLCSYFIAETFGLEYFMNYFGKLVNQEIILSEKDFESNAYCIKLMTFIKEVLGKDVYKIISNRINEGKRITNI